MLSNKPGKILVVDDFEDNLFLIENILESEGHEIILANSGLTALEQVEKFIPDLILLDVMMPKINGFEVTKRIRANQNLPFIPIVLITAYDQASVVTGLDSGADDFIHKPVEIDELLARVRSLLRLKRSIEERNQMARMREDFVSRLTHDLRTPLLAADRMLNLIKQGALGPLSHEIEKAIVTMIKSNSNLLNMVNNLLEVYRYEANRKNLYFSEVNLHDLSQEVILELQPLAEEKRISITSNLNDTLDNKKIFNIQGDKLELRRLLTNLLGNAIKFTDQGTINIKLSKKKNWLVISIEDTGSGISPEEQKYIFNRFSQGSHCRAGSGLGLHLCRQIVEIHRGKIFVKSELEKGSLFIIRLPS